jgi:hypothetical protein
MSSDRAPRSRRIRSSRIRKRRRRAGQPGAIEEVGLAGSEMKEMVA